MTEPPNRILHTELEVFADDNSFELTDESTHLDEPFDDWVDQLIADQIAARPGIVGIGTARNMPVPVTIDVLTGPPDLDLDRYDHVTEAGLTTGGTVIVAKQDDGPDAPRIEVPAGTYRVRVHYEGVDSLSEDGLDGDDTYHVVLWPGEPCEPAVLKRYPGYFPGG